VIFKSLSLVSRDLRDVYMKIFFQPENTRDGQDRSGAWSLRNRLMILLRISNDLSDADSFDDLCRHAVLMGRQVLGCQRIGLWFCAKNDSLTVNGSFGVDEEGKLRDERGRALTLSRSSPMGQVLSNKQHLLVTEDCDLRNDKGEAVGHGMHVIAALWNGSQAIGCVCIDNLLDRKAFMETDVDILGMYASTLGHLAFRKRAEDELKKSLREKEILLQEVNHRVKNNLQVISSLLNLQAAYVRDPFDADLFRQSQNRVKSMAKAYDVLSQARDLSRINIYDYIMGIVQNLYQSYRISDSTIVLRLEGIREPLPLTQAIPCGLIVNELATNALKHGFQPGKRTDVPPPRGELTISICRTEQKLSLKVGNNGAPFPADVDIYNPLTLGLQFVNTLTAQLKGTLTLDSSNGTLFTVAFPDEAKDA